MVGAALSHYRILEKLGAGGMGEVYRAEDTSLKRQVALKILPPEVASSPVRLERFQREAETLAALDHPNIVTIYAVEEADEVHFLVMQMVEGKRLSDLTPEGGMVLERIFDTAIPLADALAAAHEKGVIHRDLKPGNIMVTDDGHVKVLDFGLAKLRNERTPLDATQAPTEPLTREGCILGTVPYMSPEQLEGKEIDARTDIFSLGVVLYEMATGERPFKGGSSASIISSIMRETPREVDALRTDVPHHLARIIRHCLEKEPQRRYQSVIDVRNELEDLKQEIVLSESRAAIPPAAAGPGPGRAARYLVVLATVLALALGGYGLWHLLSPREELPPAFDPTSVAAPERKMIVVLPFENLGPPEDAYFAAGMTNEIASRLTNVGGLGVIARKSAAQYSSSDLSIQQIGEELSADYALDGTVRWAKGADGGSRVRVTPELVRIAEDAMVWTEVYDRDLEDIFALQTEISEETVRAIDATLLLGPGRLAATTPTQNLEAYDHYLKAKSYMDKIPAQNQVAAQLLDKAVALDPEFALAHAALSEVHSGMHFSEVDPTEARLLLAKRSAEQALELEPELAEAHRALGIYHYRSSRDYRQALGQFERALESSPNDAELLNWIGIIHKRQGEFAEALSFLEPARLLDPRDTGIVLETAQNLQHLGRHEEALTYIDRAIRLDPDNPHLEVRRARLLMDWTGDTSEYVEVSHELPETDEFLATRWYGLVLQRRFREAAELAAAADADPVADPAGFVWKKWRGALCHFLLGETELMRARAQERLEVTEDLARENPGAVIALANTYALLGRHDEALREGERALEAMAADVITAGHYRWNLAFIHLVLGDPERAIERLDEYLTVQSVVTAASLRTQPHWDRLHDHPRFQALLEKHAQEE